MEFSSDFEKISVSKIESGEKLLNCFSKSDNEKSKSKHGREFGEPFRKLLILVELSISFSEKFGMCGYFSGLAQVLEKVWAISLNESEEVGDIRRLRLGFG